MIICKPIIKVPEYQLNTDVLRRLERYARVCYKSEDKQNENSDFLNKIIRSGHESVIEHEKITVLFIVDRGVSHEIVRHRIASYSQESTRYCNYGQGTFGGEITVVEPFFFKQKELYNIWEKSCLTSEQAYLSMLKNHCSPQEARSVLPNSLKTEIVVTFNFREWRHFFKLRCAPNAHPQMREVTIPLLLCFKEYLYPIFGDIAYDNNFLVKNYAEVVQTNELFE